MPIRVLASVIERDQRLLVCRRPLHKRHGGLWERFGSRGVGRMKGIPEGLRSRARRWGELWGAPDLADSVTVELSRRFRSSVVLCRRVAGRPVRSWRCVECLRAGLSGELVLRHLLGVRSDLPKELGSKVCTVRPLNRARLRIDSDLPEEIRISQRLEDLSIELVAEVHDHR